MFVSYNAYGINFFLTWKYFSNHICWLQVCFQFWVHPVVSCCCPSNMADVLSAIEDEVTSLSTNISNRRFTPAEFRAATEKLKICLGFLKSQLPNSDRAESLENIIRVLLEICAREQAQGSRDEERRTRDIYKMQADTRVLVQNLIGQTRGPLTPGTYSLGDVGLFAGLSMCVFIVTQSVSFILSKWHWWFKEDSFTFEMPYFPWRFTDDVLVIGS